MINPHSSAPLATRVTCDSIEEDNTQLIRFSLFRAVAVSPSAVQSSPGMDPAIKEQQDEEREALISIYEGDDRFKEINATTFQYKYGENDDIKSFMLEISWHSNYPTEVPNLNLNLFYNRNLSVAVKSNIETVLREEAEQWVGCGMTYTLFECLKDKVEDLMTAVEESGVVDVICDKVAEDPNDNNETATKAAKKEQLTKSQKRRLWNNADHTGTKARGWNWVDLVKHLSQTGGSGDKPPE